MARRDDLVVLVPEGPRTATQAAANRPDRRAAGAALVPNWQVTVGLGDVCQAATEIARSHEQARRAVDTARRFGRRGDVVTFEELGLYRLLFHVKDPSSCAVSSNRCSVHWWRTTSGTRRTWSSPCPRYLANNGNLQATARELSLHVNSVAYRLQRIQAIAALDLEQAEDRLLAQVALKILNGTGAE